MDRIGQITIVGTGLLGTSCGLGLRAGGYRGRIAGVSRRIETAQRAKALGGVDTASTDLGPPLRESQLVVIAVPLGSYEHVLGHLAQYDHADLVVTDVGSTKQQVCADARRLLPDPTRFVGSHPMAGSERHGPDAARPDLFEGKPCVITPEPDTDPHAQSVVETLWTRLKMKLVYLPAVEHDRRVAHISHLPHALAVLLLQLARREGGLDLASTGFRDTTRVASGDPQIWSDIFATNRQAIAKAIEVFGDELAEFRQMLLDKKDETLLETLCQNKAIRDRWINEM